MRRSHALFSLALVVMSARSSNAQDVAHVGVTMAFPAAVGIIWQATDSLAIRPDFQFSQSSSGSLTSSSLSTTVGVSALFYVRKWDNLRAYLSPRFGYQHSSVTLIGTAVNPSQDQYSYAGSFGAEYQLHRRFAVFGEAGITYSHTVADNPSGFSGASVSTTGHIWGTRAGLGAIVYF